MTQSFRLVLAIGIGVLALQGCSTTGGARSGSVAPAPMASAPLSPPGVTVPEQDGKPVIKADTRQNFQAIAAAIHQQMQPGGRWQYIDKSERNAIDGSFADMDKLYVQFGSVDHMSQAAKIRLLADQGTVNAILTKKDGDRLICQTVLPVGSHLPVKTCKTYAQIQAEQRNAVEFLRTQGDKSRQQRATGH